jgi:aminopeptidase N
MEEFYWDHFAPSVPMSTYLVAFIVANFTQVEADVGNATWKFNIYARPSARNQTQLSFIPPYMFTNQIFAPEFEIIISFV